MGDPFGSSSDPFGDKKDPFGSSDKVDPFCGSEPSDKKIDPFASASNPAGDPFGESKPFDDADPFGGSGVIENKNDDPFGGESKSVPWANFGSTPAPSAGGASDFGFDAFEAPKTTKKAPSRPPPPRP